MSRLNRLRVPASALGRRATLVFPLAFGLAVGPIGYTFGPARASGPSIIPTQCVPAASCVSPSTFGGGSTTTITGTGFPPGKIIAVWLDTNGNGQLDTNETDPLAAREPFTQTTSDGGGGFSAPLLVRGVAAGSYAIQAGVCPIQDPTAPVPCALPGHVTTGIALTPVVVDIAVSTSRFGSGSTVTVTGSGFSHSAQINVWFDSNDDATLDSGDTSASVNTAADGSFSTQLVAKGQPGLYRFDAGPASTATASTAVDIGSCWFQDCFINGADTICFVGNSPTDFYSFFADCKAVDSNYTDPTPATANNNPPGGYDLSNVGPTFAGAGALAAMTNDLGPPGSGCVAINAATGLAQGYGNDVPDGGLDFTKPLTDLTDIACGDPIPFFPIPPFDLTTYVAAEGLIGNGVPDSDFLFAMIAAINTGAAAAAGAVVAAGVVGAAAGPVATSAALSALTGVVDPGIAAAMAASIGATMATIGAGLFAIAPLLQGAILLAAQAAVAEAAVAGDIACGYVDYHCNGSDITANIIGNAGLQQALIPVSFLQPPFTNLPDPNPCRSAVGATPAQGACWGGLIGWGQVACQRFDPRPDQSCEPTGSGADPELPIPGSAGNNNGSAPTRCATGSVVGLSIGYDGDVSFDVYDPNSLDLMNYHNFLLGPGGSDAPDGVDVEVPLSARQQYITQFTELRTGMRVHVCGQWVADMHMLWNELHPISSLTLLINATGTSIATTEGSLFNGTVATFTAPDVTAPATQFSASIAWGDGSVSPGVITGASGSFTVTGGHTYAEEGPESATVTITDSNDSNDTGTATSTVAVADAALTGTATAATATEGTSFSSNVFTFTDADPNAAVGDYAASIAWGDGSSSAGAVSAGSSGSFLVTGTHTYAEEGTYTFQVTVGDSGGSTTGGSATATVADAALTASGLTFNSTNPVQAVVANFGDADPGGVPSDYAATIDWGDGSALAPGTVTSSGSSFAVSGGHTYAALGPHTIGVHICDGGGSCASATTQVMTFGYSTGGAFVIGDATVGPVGQSLGKPVYFWGAQWARNNQLTAGAAPASFKGFENDPHIPACGIHWSTTSGGSAGQPSTLPAYMAVVVGSQVSAQGSGLTGDEPHVVIVQTNPGYAPQPGSPGTGTIVAVLC